MSEAIIQVSPQVGDVIEGGPWAGFEYISVYSREQALEDGELVDVSNMASQAGFTHPTAITRALFARLNNNKTIGQDFTGRLWDVLWMASRSTLRAPMGQTTVYYKVIIGRCHHCLQITVGPGDDPAPVLTIGFPEDF